MILMAVVDEWVLARPDLLHDLMAGSLPCEWMAIRRPPGRARDGGAITRLALKLSEARAVRLRSDHQIVIGDGAAGPGMINEQELVSSR